ncbi:MAG TPA: aquaporin [Pseudomonadales bacterium]|nr:aquaporin [Pseudomonadales bacterium]
MKKYLVEFIGTFFLVMTIGMTVIEPGAGAMAPLAIGSALMIMVYAGGHVSGGHYNPAVTLAVWLRGKCPTSDVVPYWTSQILGSLLASFVVLTLKHYPTVYPMDMSQHAGYLSALLAEFIGTFALAYVVLNVATAKATAGNSFYGLAIGFTVMVMAYGLGSISGGAFNVAVATAATVMHIVKATDFWIYLIGNFGGAAVAAMTFKFINPEDK